MNCGYDRLLLRTKDDTMVPFRQLRQRSELGVELFCKKKSWLNSRTAAVAGMVTSEKIGAAKGTNKEDASNVRPAAKTAKLRCLTDSYIARGVVLSR